MNIRSLLRYFFFLLAIALVCAIEKSIGLPVFFLLASLIYIEALTGYIKVVGWAVLSFILASFYGIPFSVSLLMVLALTVVYELPWTLWQRESLKVFFALLGLEIILSFIIHFHFDIFSVIYHGTAIAFAFLGIRFWFRQRHGMAKLSVAQRLKT